MKIILLNFLINNSAILKILIVFLVFLVEIDVLEEKKKGLKFQSLLKIDFIFYLKELSFQRYCQLSCKF